MQITLYENRKVLYVMYISMIEAKFVRKKYALYSGKYSRQIDNTFIYYNAQSSPFRCNEMQPAINRSPELYSYIRSLTKPKLWELYGTLWFIYGLSMGLIWKHHCILWECYGREFCLILICAIYMERNPNTTGYMGFLWEWGNHTNPISRQYVF